MSVSSTRVGPTNKLPAKALHTLTLTAGATVEELAVDIFPANDITVTGADVLDARWMLEPATLAGPLFDLISYGPAYRGPLGVQLAFRAIRAPDGHVVVAGTTEPGVWSYNRFMPDRSGRWELYARYRTTKPRVWANDTSECGEFVRVP